MALHSQCLTLLLCETSPGAQHSLSPMTSSINHTRPDINRKHHKHDPSALDRTATEFEIATSVVQSLALDIFNCMSFNTSKIHPYVEEFSLITNWKLAERLLYKQGYKKDPHVTG